MKLIVALPHCPYHAVDDVPGRRLVRLLENSLQEEWIFGQSLVRLRQHVGELLAVTLLMGLYPLNRATQTQHSKQLMGQQCEDS